jgi:WD40-like Beta Propeller Repeat
MEGFSAPANRAERLGRSHRVFPHQSRPWPVIAGPAFSPDGTRLYFSSQRGTDGKTGMTFEVTGPF